MFLQLNHPPVSFDSFTLFMDPSLVVELTSVADNMRRLKVVHLNSTATSGGVVDNTPVNGAVQQLPWYRDRTDRDHPPRLRSFSKSPRRFTISCREPTANCKSKNYESITVALKT